MAYRDPYAEQYGTYQHNAYGESDGDFNQYVNRAQPYGQMNYDSSYGAYEPYHGEPLSDHQTYGAGLDGRPQLQQPFDSDLPVKDEGFIVPPPPPPPKDANDFDMGNYSRQPRGGRNTVALRRYRMDFQGGLWTKGGRGRCFGRFCCCTIMIALFLIISILLSLALWIRPPSIIVGDVQPVSSGSTVQLQADGRGVAINLGVNISVSNPNYFGVNFREIKAEIFYPLNNTNIGGGVSNNVNFEAHAQKNFTFPFSLNYKLDNDPGTKVLVDIARKCGFGGGAKSNISVRYKITLGLLILFVPVSPTVENGFNFPCPLGQTEVEELLKTAGLTLSDILSNSSA